MKQCFISILQENKSSQASEVNLERFLLSQGEELIRSGPEKRLKRDHSVIIRGNGWYDHGIKEGDPVSSVQMKKVHLYFPPMVWYTYVRGDPNE